MKLASVRSMKEEVAFDILGGRFGPMEGITLSEMAVLPPLPSFALGISTESPDSSVVAESKVLSEAADSQEAAFLSETSSRYKLAIRLEDASDLHSPELSRILALAHGEVDVQVTGHMRALSGEMWNQKSVRPIQMGASVGHYRVSAGTIGAFVRMREGSALETYILSNAHVIAHEDRGEPGDPVIQPGAHDGGELPRDVIAELVCADTLNRSGWNLTDSAIARLKPSVPIDFTGLQGLGELNGISTRVIHKNMYLSKLGRTTNVTHGHVTAFELDIPIGFSFGRAWFRNQIEVTGIYGPFVKPGDSGSIAVDSDGAAVGLVFAGGGLTGILNPIQTVMDRLNIELAIG